MSLEAALGELAAVNPGEDICYSKIAKKYGVVRSTLTRRHKAVSTSKTTKNISQQKLNPQQERELVGYIAELNSRSLPTTRELIQNIASKVAKSPVSESWVTRFINRHSIHLIPNRPVQPEQLSATSPTLSIPFSLLRSSHHLRQASQSMPGVPARRKTRTKSRTGCLQCKKRHTKASTACLPGFRQSRPIRLCVPCVSTLICSRRSSWKGSVSGSD